MATETTTDLAYLGTLQHQLEEYEEPKMGVKLNNVELKKVMFLASAYTKMNRCLLKQR